MSSQYLTVSPTPQLDFYLNGIRIEFDRLNKELDEARKQRDEYKTNFMNREKEFQDFITTLLQRLDDKNQTCQHCRGDITHTAGVADDTASISPPSASSEYYSPLEEKGGVTDRLDNTEISIEVSPVEEERNHDVRQGAISDEDEVPTVPGITSPLLRSDESFTNEVGKLGWDIMYNGGTEIALELDLVHDLTQWGGAYVAFSPDATYLVVTSGDVECLFDVNTGERLRVMRDLYKNPGEGSNTCLDFSPDNKHVATGDAAGEVRIWTISQKRVRNMFRPQRYINDLHFSPNGQHLVIASLETVRIWRLRDGSSTVLIGREYTPWAVQFSPDGRYVASGYSLGKIRIWNVRTRRLVARWEGHGDGVSSLVFTPDGKGLLTASLDRTVVCWDIGWLSSSGDNAKGEQDVNSTVMEISRFIGHTDLVSQVSISPDGTWIASGSYDGSVKIWNARDATLQCTLCGPSQVWSVAFSHVGGYLAIGNDFPQVAVWNYACRDSKYSL